MYPAGEFCEHTMIREQGRKIVVVNFHKKSLEYIFRSILSDSTIPWAYFGKNVAHFLEIERFLGSRGNNIPVGDLLQENAGSTVRSLLITWVPVQRIRVTRGGTCHPYLKKIRMYLIYF